jgi:streptogramin lyase
MGALSQFPVPSSEQPYQIATGADGNLWFTIFNGYPTAAPQLIWRMTTAGVFTSYPTSGNPFGITQGPDGAISTPTAPPPALRSVPYLLSRLPLAS